MEKRFVGAIFCLSSAILFSSRYIAAAIFMSGVSSWSPDLFNAGLQYVGKPLFLLSIVSLFIGVVYLAWAEILEIRKV